MNSNMAPTALDISSRAVKSFASDMVYLGAVTGAMGPNAYNAETNKNGYIVLGLAENVLTFDMLKEKLISVSGELPLDTVQYWVKGYPPFLEQCAKFLSRHMIHNHTVKASDLTVSCGCSPIIENTFWALCDPGDAVIIPTPCYPAFQNDLTLRIGCHVVYTKVHPKYRLTVDILDEAYDRALKESKCVKALLLTNPNNPQGVIYTRSELEMAAQWASDHDLHLVSDEIYANSMFSPNPTTPFISMADVADMSKGNVHIMWGFSKDFGLNGFRIGLLYTQSPRVMQALGSVTYFGQASTHTQYILSQVLQDEAWTDEFLAKNAANMYESWKMLTAWLDSHSIPYYDAQGAHFCWINLSKFLPENTFEGEKALFTRMWKEAKVIMTPGEACHMDVPGYFRCCFPSRTIETLKTGLERLEDLLFKQ